MKHFAFESRAIHEPEYISIAGNLSHSLFNIKCAAKFIYSVSQFMRNCDPRELDVISKHHTVLIETETKYSKHGPNYT